MRSRRLFVPLTILLSAATCAKVSDAQANVAPDASPGMSPMADHTLGFLPQVREERRNPVIGQ